MLYSSLSWPLLVGFGYIVCIKSSLWKINLKLKDWGCKMFRDGKLHINIFRNRFDPLNGPEIYIYKKSPGYVQVLHPLTFTTMATTEGAALDVAPCIQLPDGEAFLQELADALGEEGIYPKEYQAELQSNESELKGRVQELERQVKYYEQIVKKLLTS